MDTPALHATPPRPYAKDPARVAAEKMEAQFLSQMLKLAGVGKPPSGYDGGEGEAQFQSLLCDEQAKAMVAAGGIGLAETIFQSLVAKQDG